MYIFFFRYISVLSDMVFTHDKMFFKTIFYIFHSAEWPTATAQSRVTWEFLGRALFLHATVSLYMLKISIMKQTGQIIGDEPAGCVKNSKYCYDSIPEWGFRVSLEGVGQVWVGTYRCTPSIVHRWLSQYFRRWGQRVGGESEVQRFGSKFGEVRIEYQRSLSKAERHIRDVCQRWFSD